MNFLLDVNIPSSLGKRLQEIGHTYRWVPHCLSPTASDSAIMQEAVSAGEVILTHDTDFGMLLSFSGVSKPSVVLFRIDKINSDLFLGLLVDNWHLISEPLSKGALIIFESDKFRIRELPIRR
jgi:predicted nuclease of predicted toxin-antitoxin system